MTPQVDVYKNGRPSRGPIFIINVYSRRQVMIADCKVIRKKPFNLGTGNIALHTIEADQCQPMLPHLRYASLLRN